MWPIHMQKSCIDRIRMIHTCTYLQTVKLTGPDYKNFDPEEAVRDFEKRIKNYELVYEPLSHVDDK